MKIFKSIISFVLVFALTFSCTTLHGASNVSSTHAWDGSVTRPKDTNKDTVYEITNGSELAYALSGKGDSIHYILTKDIVLNDISVKIEDGVGVIYDAFGDEVTDTSSLNKWSSTTVSNVRIDGKGHTIRGLFFDDASSTGKFGLAYKGWNVDFVNLGIEDMYANVPNGYVAAFIGDIGGQDSNEILNCYVGESVYINAVGAAGFFAWGGQSTNNTLSVKNAYCLATLDGSKAGAITGDVWGCDTSKATATNVYSTSKIYGNNAFKADNETNCYRGIWDKSGNKETSVSQMKGANALTVMSLGEAFATTDSYPILKAFIYPGYDIWDGTVATSFSGGSGDYFDPYLISSGAELALAVMDCDIYYKKHFKITNDIYLNDLRKIDFSTGEVDEGYTPNTWISEYITDSNSAYIYGDGHMIYGLYVNNPKSDKFAALFPYTYNGVRIYDLGIDNLYFNVNNASAAFVGYHKNATATKSTFNNCFVGGNANITGKHAAGFIGYGVGTANFKNCYSIATVLSTATTGLKRTAGFTADTDNMKIVADNCYTNTYFAYGNSSSSYNNCYAVGQSGVAGITVLTVNQMQKTLMDGNSMALGRDFYATSTYPQLTVFGSETYKVWNGLAELFYTGDGSPEKPYIIESTGQLAYMVGTGGNGCHYKMANDIYINEIDKIDWKNGNSLEGSNYTPNTWFTGTNEVGHSYNNLYGNDTVFTGHFDGNGYSVYGLWYDTELNDIASGLIPAAKDSTVKNLVIDYAYVVGGRCTGTLSSYFGGTLEKCYVGDSVTILGKKIVSGTPSIGGIIGWSEGIELTDCGFSGTISDDLHTNIRHIYGLIGTSWGTKIDATNCYSLGYQPFTVSTPVKEYTDSDTALKKLEQDYHHYTVDSVYTDVHYKDNTAVVKWDKNGIDDDGDGKLEYDASKTIGLFDFDELATEEMLGLNALRKMKLSNDVWYAVENAAPKLRIWGATNYDVDGDSEFATNDDVANLRNKLLGVNSSVINSDINRDNSSNICDLVLAYIKMSDNDIVYHKYIGESLVNYTFNDNVDFNSYTIVYPNGNTKICDLANSIKTHYSTFGIDITVKSDSNTASNREIVIGETNRHTERSLKYVHSYASYVENGKLFIRGTTDEALATAVRNYIKISDSPNRLYEIDGFAYIQPEITLSNGNKYSYVWGDEFNTSYINSSKWVYSVSNTNMGNNVAAGKEPDIAVLSNPDVINIVDGNLRLTPISYTDESHPNIKYGVPASVRTRDKMGYRYGYAEIRAKVPFKQGVWPSFWTLPSTGLGEINCKKYGVEVDIFEVFGSVNTITPQIHKWYADDYDYNAIHGGNVEDNHTKWNAGATYAFNNFSNLSNEYHTYGFEWTPTEMSMYVDGVCYQTYDITTSYDKCSDTTGFHDARYIIFNNHVFSPNSEWIPGDSIDQFENNLPANYDIDYFRLYQSEELSNSKVWLKH